jgi:hypothetical protein
VTTSSCAVIRVTPDYFVISASTPCPHPELLAGLLQCPCGELAQHEQHDQREDSADDLEGRRIEAVHGPALLPVQVVGEFKQAVAQGRAA